MKRVLLAIMLLPDDKVMRTVERYVTVIHHMETARNMSAVTVYQMLDKERASLHEEILRVAKASRDDAQFNSWLSALVEEMLPGIREKSM